MILRVFGLHFQLIKCIITISIELLCGELCAFAHISTQTMHTYEAERQIIMKTQIAAIEFGTSKIVTVVAAAAA